MLRKSLRPHEAKEGWMKTYNMRRLLSPIPGRNRAYEINSHQKCSSGRANDLCQKEPIPFQGISKEGEDESYHLNNSKKERPGGYQGFHPQRCLKKQAENLPLQQKDSMKRMQGGEYCRYMTSTKQVTSATKGTHLQKGGQKQYTTRRTLKHR